MKLHRTIWLVPFGILACSSESRSIGDADGTRDTNDAVTTACSTRLVPSNLPADICNTPGASDLNVPAGGNVTLSPNDPCDALVPQGAGLPAICVRKFANVTVAGSLSTSSNGQRAIAIVATGNFTLSSGGLVRTTDDSGGDPRGMGGQRPGEAGGGSGGAGHVGAGAPGGKSGAVGGTAYGPTTGTQIVSGAYGGYGGTIWDGIGGSAGGAIQLVACGDLALSGTVSVSGGNGSAGSDGYTPHMSIPGGGGGGGSGGTIMVDAKRISVGGGALLAVGGSGGRGGHAPEQGAVGGPGGAGGTGAGAPQPGAGPTGGFIAGGGGGGGAVGRIVLHVADSGPTPDITADPPASTTP